jgi:hypothetical protein
MILLLARAADEIATEFNAYLESRGVSSAIISSSDELEVSLRMTSAGTVDGSVRIQGTWYRLEDIRGIFNRAEVGHWISGEGFEASERLAAAWALLALAPCPVINRPGSLGFMSFTDPVTFSPIEGSHWSIPTILATDETRADARLTSTYKSIRHAALLGRTSTPREVRVCTGFDPNATRYLLLAGERLLDLSSHGNAPAEHVITAFEPLRRRAAGLSTNFALFVVQSEPSNGMALIHATAYPQYSVLAHAASSAFAALADYLGVPS